MTRLIIKAVLYLLKKQHELTERELSNPSNWSNGTHNYFETDSMFEEELIKRLEKLGKT